MRKPQWTKCILYSENEILLVLQKNNKKWTLPGGGIEKSENPKNCVRREIKEELGVDLESIKKIGKWSTDYRGFDEIIYYFKSEVNKNNIFINDDEINKFKWVSLDNISENTGKSVKKGLKFYKC